MNHPSLALVAALLLLAACSGSHRPTYSGHQESTEGVPGFKNGKKTSQYVKLGQSYTVDGETHVPRHQPDYVEEGMASWYGPGFHGGKTANGERFDSHDLTAAHRTLPLPSIVRVTMLSNGKQAIVRVNDRGPFAHSRIIDLSRGAAEKIGLLRSGVGKVRVEYMQAESERFAQLLGEGRDPKSIDLASEVLQYEPGTQSSFARGDVRQRESEVAQTTPENSVVEAREEKSGASFWDRFSPVSSAKAASPSATHDAAPVTEVARADLSSPQGQAEVEEAASSPFSLWESAPEEKPTQLASLSPSHTTEAPAITASGDQQKIYVQLGAFGNESNAERLRKQFATIAGLDIVKKPTSSGQMLYHVRMGPYADNEAANQAVQRAQQAGAEVKLIRE